jgi:hypothetical protein
MTNRSVSARFGQLLLLALLAVTVAAAETFDNNKTLQKSWTLLHSFGDATATATATATSVFTKRGTIRLSIDENAAGASTDPAKAVTMEIENEVEFSPADVQAMLEHGWYQLKIVPEDDDNKDSKQSSKVPAVRTSVPACQLRRANFRYVTIVRQCQFSRCFLDYCASMEVYCFRASEESSLFLLDRSLVAFMLRSPP